MASISLRSLAMTYPNGHVALHGISLDIADGEFVVLVGPSGCGKSTALRLVAGLEHPSSGQVLIDSRVVNDIEPKDRDVAMVFQNYALYPHMTAEANMGLALKIRGTPAPEVAARVRAAAETLGIAALLGRKPGEMSGGQRQRVALGRAIVRKPKAFLFDEPLSNLDAKLRSAMRAELKTLHHRLKTTSLYVTHDQEEAMTLGDRIIVMNEGRVQQVGPPLEVYRRPVNRFVAGFVGTPAMNFFDGVLEARGAGLAFVPAGAPRDAIAVHESHARHLAPAAGQRIVLGLRPHAFSESEAPGYLPCTVQVVEPMGEWMDLTAPVWGVRALARLAARDGLNAGETAHLRPDMAQAHWFSGSPEARSLVWGG